MAHSINENDYSKHILRLPLNNMVILTTVYHTAYINPLKHDYICLGCSHCSFIAATLAAVTRALRSAATTSASGAMTGPLPSRSRCSSALKRGFSGVLDTSVSASRSATRASSRDLKFSLSILNELSL